MTQVEHLVDVALAMFVGMATAKLRPQDVIAAYERLPASS